MFEFVLRKRGSANRRRMGGFESAKAAADGALRELENSDEFDDFRVYESPGGDVEFD